MGVEVINVWGDESSQNGHKYMVLGTLWQKPEVSNDLNRDIENMKRQTGFKRKLFHWNDLKKLELPSYKGLIQIFKEYLEQDVIKYRALVVDQTDITHKIYSQYDDELHFYKMYFWLIYKRLRSNFRYDIFLHRKSNHIPGRLIDLRGALNNKFYIDHWNTNITQIVRRVEAKDGSQIELQIVDVLTGAIAYVRNGHYEKTKKKNPLNPKVQLVNFIEEQLNVPLTSCHSAGISPEFNIWFFQRRK